MSFVEAKKKNISRIRISCVCQVWYYDDFAVNYDRAVKSLDLLFRVHDARRR